MEELLKEYAVKALNWLESGAAWIAGELPVYVNEVLMWEIASNIVWSIIGVVFMLGILFGFRFTKSAMKITKEQGKEYYANHEIAHGVAAFFLFSFGIAGFIIFTTNTLELVKVLVAPRVYLIEYLTKML